MNKNFLKYEFDAINLMRSSNLGILSTHSEKFSGYPFGSFTSYASSRSRMIYFFFSDLAQHTVNLNENPKSCFTIFKVNSDGNLQNSARLTLMGDLRIVDQKKVDDCSAQYQLSLPESKEYSKMHDFNFYQFEINQIRWIGGFGQIAWLNAESWKDINPGWIKSENSIIDHMNKDHSKSIQSSLNAHHNIKDKESKIIRLTIDGYYVKCKEGIFFIQFRSLCNTAEQYKDQLVAQAKKYKEFEL